MQQLQHVILRGGQHFDVEQRELHANVANGGQQAVRIDLGAHANRQFAFQALGQLQRMHLQLFELFGHQSRMGNQRQRQVGGHWLAVAAIKQQVTQLGLKVADAHAHCRRHPAQGTRRCGKGATLHHRKEQLDTVAGKTHCTTCQLS